MVLRSTHGVDHNMYLYSRPYHTAERCSDQRGIAGFQRFTGKNICNADYRLRRIKLQQRRFLDPCFKFERWKLCLKLDQSCIPRLLPAQPIVGSRA